MDFQPGSSRLSGSLNRRIGRCLSDVMAQAEHSAWRIFIVRGDHGDVATLFGKRPSVGLCGENFADLNFLEEQRVRLIGLLCLQCSTKPAPAPYRLSIEPLIENSANQVWAGGNHPDRPIPHQ
jgi:hypothetical protein